GRIEELAHELVLVPVVAHPRRDFRVIAQQGLDHAAALVVEMLVDEEVQLMLVDRQRHGAHFTRRRWRARPSPLASAGSANIMLRRKASRPRATRDMMVPIGTPTTRAASS